MTRARDLAAFVSNADGDIKFDTDTLFIDSSTNRVGIGTDSPQTDLHIKETGGLARIRLEGTAASADNFEFGQGTTGVVNSGFEIRDVDASATRLVIDTNGKVGIGTSSPAALLDLKHNSASTHLRLTENTSGNYAALGVDTSDNLRIYANNNERMRIDSSGNVLVGTTASNYPSTTGTTISPVSLTVSRDSGSPMDLNRGQNDGQIIGFRRSSTAVGSISVSSSATAFNTSSDYRLKENVTDITDGITRVKQLAPKRFNFIADADTTVDGFLAHEAQTVVPEAVTGTKDAMTEEVLYVDGDEIPDGKKVGDVKTASTIDPQGIDQSKIVPLLTAALQEAIAKIETLETKVAALEAE